MAGEPGVRAPVLELGASYDVNKARALLTGEQKRPGSLIARLRSVPRLFHGDGGYIAKPLPSVETSGM